MKYNRRTVMIPSKLRMSTGGCVCGEGLTRERRYRNITPRGLGGWTRYQAR